MFEWESIFFVLVCIVEGNVKLWFLIIRNSSFHQHNLYFSATSLHLFGLNSCLDPGSLVTPYCLTLVCPFYAVDLCFVLLTCSCSLRDSSKFKVHWDIKSNLSPSVSVFADQIWHSGSLRHNSHHFCLCKITWSKDINTVNLGETCFIKINVIYLIELTQCTTSQYHVWSDGIM